jgi:hypothetical protein
MCAPRPVTGKRLAAPEPPDLIRPLSFAAQAAIK